jgi:hypothetical protein
MVQERRAEKKTDQHTDPSVPHRKDGESKANDGEKLLEANEKVKRVLGKAGISLLISAILAGVSVAVKADRRIAGGTFIGAFILAYLAQSIVLK